MEATQLVATVLKAKKSLSSIGSTPYEGEESSVKGEDTDGLVTGVDKRFLYVVGIGGAVSGFATMALTVGSIADIAGISVCFLGPIAVLQKRKLNILGDIRSVSKQLLQSVDVFKEENKKLAANMTNLESSLKELKTVEHDLAEVAKKSGGDADRLVNIIRLNGEIQEQIKAKLEASVLQSVLQAVLVSDMNEDFTLNQRELKRLETRLSNLPAIKFDRNNFRKFVAGRDLLTLPDVMALIHNLKDDIPEKDCIFHLHPEKL